MSARATTWSEVTAELEFDRHLEAGDPRWHDVSAARGDKAIERVRRCLERTPPGTPVHIALASHRGAGKSTEMRRLTQSLAARYHAIYVMATEEMDPNRSANHDYWYDIHPEVSRIPEVAERIRALAGGTP